MKLGKIVDPRFQTVLNKISKEPLPISVTFQLKSIVGIAREQARAYEDARQAALMKHGQKNEDGTLKVDERSNVQFEEVGLNAFLKEMSELNEVSIDVPQISRTSLGSDLTISLADLELLSDVIAEN